MLVLRVPGDKSISHRALLLAALGEGPSEVRGLLDSADIEASARALRALGVPMPPLDATLVVVPGHNHQRGVERRHRHPEGAQRARGRLDVGGIEEAANLAGALAERGEEEGAMRDRLVAGDAQHEHGAIITIWGRGHDGPVRRPVRLPDPPPHPNLRCTRE